MQTKHSEEQGQWWISVSEFALFSQIYKKLLALLHSRLP